MMITMTVETVVAVVIVKAIVTIKVAIVIITKMAADPSRIAMIVENQRRLRRRRKIKNIRKTRRKSIIVIKKASLQKIKDKNNNIIF